MVVKLARWLRIDVIHITKAENQFQRLRMGIVLIERMMPGVHTLINIPAGLANITFIPFLVTTFAEVY